MLLCKNKRLNRNFPQLTGYNNCYHIFDIHAHLTTSPQTPSYMKKIQVIEEKYSRQQVHKKKSSTKQ